MKTTVFEEYQTLYVLVMSELDTMRHNAKKRVQRQNRKMTEHIIFFLFQIPANYERFGVLTAERPRICVAIATRWISLKNMKRKLLLLVVTEYKLKEKSKST